MLCFRLSTALLLAVEALFLFSVGARERVITCDTNRNVVILSCDYGVVNVQSALYGRTVGDICSDGIPANQLNNTQCSLNGTEKLIKTLCDGKQHCELTSEDYRTGDPCPGIYKYMDTTYICAPAARVLVCEGSTVNLQCDIGQVITIYGADYGRRDRTTCAFKRKAREVQNVDCSNPTEVVKQRCNGNSSCAIPVTNKVFGDPCPGTYKYLEVAYFCGYPVFTPNPSTN